MSVSILTPMTRLYTFCSAADGATMAAQLLRCIDDVSRWMSSNRLKLNVDKTQIIWLGAPRQLQQVSHVQLVVDGVVYGVPVKVTRRLQALVHAAARLITSVRRNQHITATLRDTLHWLPASTSAHSVQSRPDGVWLSS